MKDTTAYEKDLASIRTMMERSVKFISLSGLAGVLAGTYALAGSAFAYFMIASTPSRLEDKALDDAATLAPLIILAAVVLVLSIGTGCLLSWRKAKKIGVPVWNSTSKQLLIDLLIPLVTGGVLILIFISRGYFALIVPATLVFYGLALIQGGRSTFEEIKYLGFTEIGLGLAAAMLPGYGLAFWSAGFGAMHMIYGALMHYRYDR